MFNYFFLCSLCNCSIKTHLSRTTTAKLHIPTNVSAIFHIANVANTTFWLNSTFSVICPSSYCNTFHKSFFGGGNLSDILLIKCILLQYPLSAKMSPLARIPSLYKSSSVESLTVVTSICKDNQVKGDNITIKNNYV